MVEFVNGYISSYTGICDCICKCNHITYLVMQVFVVVFVDGYVVQQNCAPLGLVEMFEQVDAGAFSTAAGADQRHHLSRRHAE